MIFVDEINEYQSGRWCHMWTDGSDSELDKFALSIGLKKKWSHTSNGLSGRFYHYDLRPSKRIQDYDYDYDLLTERMAFVRLLELDNQAFRKIESGDYDELDEINQEIDDILLSLVKRRQLINE